MICSGSDRGLNIGLELKEDLITNSKKSINVMFVGLALHPLLCAQEVLTDRVHNEEATFKPLLKIRNSNGVIRSNAEVSRMMPIDDLKGGFANCRVPIAILPKFTKREPLRPTNELDGH